MEAIKFIHYQPIEKLKIPKHKILSSEKYRHIKAEQLIIADHPYRINNDAYNDELNMPDWIFNWLKEKNHSMVISADYDGIICSSFLSHYLNWNLVGYYNYESIWLSKEAEKNKSDIIWVDLNILPEFNGLAE